MNKKSILIIIVIIAAAVGLVIFFSNKSSAPEQTEELQSVVAPELAVFTAEEVAIHNTKDDCWTIINDGVYDLTSYVQRHPGGDEVLRACGTDGTTLFSERKTADGEDVGSGTPHSSGAQSQLEQYQIGSL